MVSFQTLKVVKIADNRLANYTCVSASRSVIINYVFDSRYQSGTSIRSVRILVQFIYL